MAKKKNITKTLFELDWKKSFPARAKDPWPYAMLMERLQENSDHQEEFGGSEGCIFPDAHLSGNILEYGSYLHMSGRLTIQQTGKPVLNLEQKYQYFPPGWPEEDGIKFLKCKARGILLTDLWADDCKQLLNCAHFNKLNLILAQTHGLPRNYARRILHRITKQFKVPIYTLTDNDTWGYFYFSILKRGVVPPHLLQTQLALTEVRYLGLRAGDAERFSVPEKLRIKWKPHYTLRLNAMREYPCFKSKKWHHEFNTLEKHHYTLDLGPLIRFMGVERFVEDYLKLKIAAKDWLE